VARLTASLRFMRDMTREEVEKVARARQVGVIDLASARRDRSRPRHMNEVIAGYVRNKKS